MFFLLAKLIYRFVSGLFRSLPQKSQAGHGEEAARTEQPGRRTRSRCSGVVKLPCSRPTTAIIKFFLIFFMFYMCETFLM